MPYLGRVSTFRAEHEITFEVMKRVQRIVKLVVVEERELKMHLRGLRRAVERGFIEIDRPQIIALRCLPICLFNQPRVARRHHPVATRQ